MEETIKITDELITLILQLLEEKLNDNKRRAYPMPDIYRSLETKIKETYSDVDRYKFQKALSLATKNGRLTGYEIKLGKNGGIGKVTYKKPGTETTVTAVVTTLPAPKELSSLEFNGKSYRLELSKDKLEKLLTKVFRVQEDPDGDLVFDERHFMVESSDTRECVENLVFYFSESDNQENEEET